jgi:hypothetical protein
MKILIAREKTMHIFRNSGGCFALSLREPEDWATLEATPEITLKHLPSLRESSPQIRISFPRN